MKRPAVLTSRKFTLKTVTHASFPERAPAVIWEQRHRLGRTASQHGPDKTLSCIQGHQWPVARADWPGCGCMHRIRLALSDYIAHTVISMNKAIQYRSGERTKNSTSYIAANFITREAITTTASSRFALASSITTHASNTDCTCEHNFTPREYSRVPRERLVTRIKLSSEL